MADLHKKTKPSVCLKPSVTDILSFKGYYQIRAKSGCKNWESFDNAGVFFCLPILKICFFNKGKHTLEVNGVSLEG